MPGRLLAWYDAHHRDLPWRISPSALAAGVRPDPYHVWLSEIMLQQTTVEAVKPYFRKFLEKWPEVTDLAAAGADDVMKAWAGLGYYSRARNLKKCADLVASLPGSRFPDEEEGLRELPGVGAYTAAAIAAIAFGRKAAVIDGNVERVMSRLFEIRTPLPDSKPEIRCAAGGTGPCRPAGRFCAGDDGSRRDDLHAEASALHALSGARGLPRHRLRRSGASARPRREGREAAAARCSLCGRPERWRDPVAHPAGQGPARRHERGADIRLDRPYRWRHECRKVLPFRPTGGAPAASRTSSRISRWSSTSIGPRWTERWRPPAIGGRRSRPCMTRRCRPS